MIHFIAYSGALASFIALLVVLKLLRMAMRERDISFIIGFGCSALLCAAAFIGFFNATGA